MTPRHLLITLGCFLMTASSAHAAELTLTGQPRSWDVRSRPARVAGYDGATWGMGVDAVKALIAARHPAALASLKDETDPVDRTRALAVVVPSLPPVDAFVAAPATVSYVFGAKSRGLVAVHVAWLLDGEPTAAERTALVAAATAIASDHVGFQWPVLATTRGRVLGPGAFVLFSGRDDAGAGLELRLDGVAMDVERPRSTPQHRPAPPGPARLHLSFAADVDRPDVYRIPPGAF